MLLVECRLGAFAFPASTLRVDAGAALRTRTLSADAIVGLIAGGATGSATVVGTLRVVERHASADRPVNVFGDVGFDGGGNSRPDLEHL